jgi:hypothetical protein
MRCTAQFASVDDVVWYQLLIQLLLLLLPGIPRKPLNTRWARSAASSACNGDEAEAAAIRETLTAYRFAGVF